jgi:hypothetical protein
VLLSWWRAEEAVSVHRIHDEKDKNKHKSEKCKNRNKLEKIEKIKQILTKNAKREKFIIHHSHHKKSFSTDCKHTSSFLLYCR